MNLYEILGVRPTDDTATIQAAYRRRAKETHPDKGGDTEVFQQVQKAWDILGDEKRRADYDATGQLEDVALMRYNRVMAELGKGFMETLKHTQSFEYTDIIKQLEQGIKNGQQHNERERSKMEKEIAKLTVALERLTVKEGAANFLGGVIQSTIDTIKRNVEGISMMIEDQGTMLEVLANYQYRVDERPKQQYAPNTTTSTIIINTA